MGTSTANFQFLAPQGPAVATRCANQREIRHLEELLSYENFTQSVKRCQNWSNLSFLATRNSPIHMKFSMNEHTLGSLSRAEFVADL